MSESENNSGAHAIGCLLFVLSPATSVLSAMYYAWAATILWQWFIEPHEHVPAPAYAVMVGVSYIFHLYNSHDADNIKAEFREGTVMSRYRDAIIMAFLKPLFVLAFAWCVHHFVK